MFNKGIISDPYPNSQMLHKLFFFLMMRFLGINLIICKYRVIALYRGVVNGFHLPVQKCHCSSSDNYFAHVQNCQERQWHNVTTNVISPYR